MLSVTGWIILAIAAVTGVGATLIWSQTQRMRPALKGRDEMSLDQQYRTFLAADGVSEEIFNSAMREVGEFLHVRPELLRPTDAFSSLRPRKGWEYDDGLSLIGPHIEQLASGKQLAIDPGTITTISDYVRAMQRIADA